MVEEKNLKCIRYMVEKRLENFSDIWFFSLGDLKIVLNFVVIIL